MYTPYWITCLKRGDLPDAWRALKRDIRAHLKRFITYPLNVWVNNTIRKWKVIEMPVHELEDCSACTFIGNIVDPDHGVCDVYWHAPKSKEKWDYSIIIRYGYDGDYSSGLVFAECYWHKREYDDKWYKAYALAVRAGLVSGREEDYMHFEPEKSVVVSFGPQGFRAVNGSTPLPV